MENVKLFLQTFRNKGLTVEDFKKFFLYSRASNHLKHGFSTGLKFDLTWSEFCKQKVILNLIFKSLNKYVKNIEVNLLQGKSGVKSLAPARFFMVARLWLGRSKASTNISCQKLRNQRQILSDDLFLVFTTFRGKF